MTVPLTRRDLGGLAGAAALATAVPAAASAATTKHHKPQHHKPVHHHSPEPIGAVEHLLRRTTYGATPELVHQVKQEGMWKWLEDQLAPHRVADHAMDHFAKRWPSLHRGIWQTRRYYADSFGTWDVMSDLVDVHIARAAWSNRQLLEIMVDFWSNHLNVTCPSSDVWDNRHVYDKDVIRKHALGSFSDMLCSAGRAPAMLQYLGNAYSDRSDPNENWGRELLELHTVGLAAGYSQKDVTNSARILTGLSVDDDGGTFEYKPWMHYTGHVKVLGFSAANHSASHGQAVAMDYLKYLAHHPDTARHIATKLATRFVSDNPPKSLVHRLAATYLHNGTHVVPVLRQLFHSKEFVGSHGQKMRTPYEDFISTIRLLRIKPPKLGTDAVRSLQYMVADIGQPPMGWHAPNGYPDVAPPWSSTSATLGKWNVHMNLAGQWYPNDLHFSDLASLVGRPVPKTMGHLIDRLVASLTLPAFNHVQRQGLAEFAGHKVGDAITEDDDVFQWRLPYLVALILDSSHQAER